MFQESLRRKQYRNRGTDLRDGRMLAEGHKDVVSKVNPFMYRLSRWPKCFLLEKAFCTESISLEKPAHPADKKSFVGYEFPNAIIHT
jgi:hypothetical protein